MNFQQIRDFVNPAVGQATGIEPVGNLVMPVPTAHLFQAGDGGSITIDSELSETSTNPVENRVIMAALKQVGYDTFFVINMIRDNDTYESTIDKTFNEIKDAIFSGKIVILKLTDLISESRKLCNFYQLWGSRTIDDQDAVSFLNMQFEDISEIRIAFVTINIKADNTFTEEIFHVLPYNPSGT